MVTAIKGNATSTFGGNVDVTGNVITDAPAFSAYNGVSNQSFSVTTWTKVTLPNTRFNTSSAFDTTNYRFQPSVAGYYQINGKVGLQGSSGTPTRIICGLFQNGSEIRLGMDISNPTSLLGTSPNLSALVYLNGSTDYVELYVYVIGGTPVVQNAASHTYFEGYLARAV